jgi:hypothetical protein
MPFPKPMPVVEVEWDDSCSGGGWSTADQYAKRDVLPACSVGYLLSRDRTRIIIVQSQAENGDVNDCITIPRGMVKQIRVLEKARRRGKS